jgi:hypothetical protein
LNADLKEREKKILAKEKMLAKREKYNTKTSKEDDLKKTAEK